MYVTKGKSKAFVSVAPEGKNHIPLARIKHKDCFTDLYPNIFLIAKTNSGKTNLIYDILGKCTGRCVNGDKTKIIVFCGSLNLDSTWIGLKKKYKKNMEAYDTIIDDDGSNILEEVVADIVETRKIEDEEQSSARLKGVKVDKSPSIFDNIDNSNFGRKKPKKRIPKKVSPQYILIIDDLSHQMKRAAAASIASLLKESRHLRMMVILSSQCVTDLPTNARAQCKSCILFKGMGAMRLETIHAELANYVPKKVFMKAYNRATREPFSWLKLDKINDTLTQRWGSIKDEIYEWD